MKIWDSVYIFVYLLGLNGPIFFKSKWKKQFKTQKQYYQSFKNKLIYYLHVQQTPNPLAQEPAEVPPLFVHSDLKCKFVFIVNTKI